MVMKRRRGMGTASWRAGKAKDMKSKIDGSEFLYKGTTLPNKGICHVEKCSAMLGGKGRI